MLRRFVWSSSFRRFVVVFVVSIVGLVFWLHLGTTAEVLAPEFKSRRETFLKTRLPLQLPSSFSSFIDEIQFPNRTCQYGLKVSWLVFVSLGCLYPFCFRLERGTVFRCIGLDWERTCSTTRGISACCASSNACLSCWRSPQCCSRSSTATTVPANRHRKRRRRKRNGLIQSQGFFCGFHPISSCADVEVWKGSEMRSFAEQNKIFFGHYGKKKPFDLAVVAQSQSDDRVDIGSVWMQHEPKVWFYLFAAFCSSCFFSRLEIVFGGCGCPNNFELLEQIEIGTSWHDIAGKWNWFVVLVCHAFWISFRFDAFDHLPDGRARANKDVLRWRSYLIGYLFQPLPQVMNVIKQKVGYVMFFSLFISSFWKDKSNWSEFWRSMCVNSCSSRRQIQGFWGWKKNVVFDHLQKKGVNGFHKEGNYHHLDDYLERATKLIKMHNVSKKKVLLFVIFFSLFRDLER